MQRILSQFQSEVSLIKGDLEFHKEILTSTTHHNKVCTNAHLISCPTRVVPIDKFFINFTHGYLQLYYKI